MPFGAKNAGACYSQFLELIIKKLRSPYILSYLDDVIVHTNMVKQHLGKLEKRSRYTEKGVFGCRPERLTCFRKKPNI